MGLSRIDFMETNTEDDLKRLLYNFHLSCLKFNMKTSIHKTKATKEPLLCKLEIDGRMVEQVMQFNYLGVKLPDQVKW